jgi:tRNA (mo5U34)-methyltransferase
MNEIGVGDLARRVERLRWYHTLDLPGVETPGEFDLRPTVPVLPWPAGMDGLRCIDIGARDGFYAFEMERRGAAEVVAVDIADPAAVDFPHARPDEAWTQYELDAGALAFGMAKEALGSKVARRHISVYDLDPEDVGEYDFAVMGTLLHHLRDPLRALASVRKVVRGQFMLCAHVTPSIDAFRRRPMAQISELFGPYWAIANPAGYRRWMETAGFDVLSVSRPYFIRRGRGGRTPSVRSTIRRPVRETLGRLVLRHGMPHVAILAK